MTTQTPRKDLPQGKALLGLPIDFAPGGQAVLEGVLMRSPNYIAVAVRNPQGKIVFDKKAYKPWGKYFKFLALPLVRGMIGICEMMIIGFKALNFSSEVFMQEEELPVDAPKKETTATDSVLFAFSLIFAFAMSIFLFKFVPLFITTQLQNFFPIVKNNYLVFNLIDGVIKLGLFVGYLALMLLSKEMKRVFEYHGAEHKAVWTYEKNLDLTVENAKMQTRLHPRCGTSFIIIVFVISIFVYMFLPKQDTFIMNFLLRIAMLPLIGGVAYEVLKWSARRTDNAFVRILVAPGLLLQRITTQEPDDSQLEVALRALEATIELEQTGLETPAKLAPELV
ncbi:MAG: DUF1385 domain-containing protein [Candidatus Peregrinibacteria bacterium]|nr:DUF1385 domain-containing protein [Candidatus Peregrinibacteria bacterium]